jgi:hypothetical protein
VPESEQVPRIAALVARDLVGKHLLTARFAEGSPDRHTAHVDDHETRRRRRQANRELADVSAAETGYPMKIPRQDAPTASLPGPAPTDPKRPDDVDELQRLWLGKRPLPAVKVAEVVGRVMQFALDPDAPHAIARTKRGVAGQIAAGEFTRNEVETTVAAHLAGRRQSRPQELVRDVVDRMAGIDGVWTAHRWLDYRPSGGTRIYRASAAFVASGLDLDAHWIAWHAAEPVPGLAAEFGAQRDPVQRATDLATWRKSIEDELGLTPGLELVEVIEQWFRSRLHEVELEVMHQLTVARIEARQLWNREGSDLVATDFRMLLAANLWNVERDWRPLSHLGYDLEEWCRFMDVPTD